MADFSLPSPSAFTFWVLGLGFGEVDEVLFVLAISARWVGNADVGKGEREEKKEKEKERRFE